MSARQLDPQGVRDAAALVQERPEEAPGEERVQRVLRAVREYKGGDDHDVWANAENALLGALSAIRRAGQ